jgi:hypothetical protein
LALFLLAACSSPQVDACEKQLLEKLKAPSTYERIGLETMTLNSGDPPHYFSVTIEYDAQNSYGALLRDKEQCDFRLDSKGRPTLEMFDPYASLADPTADLSAAEAMADNALDAAGQAIEDAGSAVEAAASEGYAYEPEPTDPPSEADSVANAATNSDQNESVDY